MGNGRRRRISDRRNFSTPGNVGMPHVDFLDVLVLFDGYVLIWFFIHWNFLAIYVFVSDVCGLLNAKSQRLYSSLVTRSKYAQMKLTDIYDFIHKHNLDRLSDDRRSLDIWRAQSAGQLRTHTGKLRANIGKLCANTGNECRSVLAFCSTVRRSYAGGGRLR